jgi:protocatechuate 3,4-dioxygenase beta subunit
MPFRRAFFLAALCLAGCLAAVQGRAADTVRTLSGHVLDSANQPLYKAVVYLKNTKTLVIRTYITEKDGSFRFSALSPNVDYEVYADHQGDRSDVKTLSAFDNRKKIVFTLRVHSR